MDGRKWKPGIYRIERTESCVCVLGVGWAMYVC